ncbi:hypothetical protein [Arenimonas daejeonensis]|uniref:hypothetical protein n=1 Tax=Arenimonas daejeonensis TaxID=370777 RepID=UPI001D137FAD|nr:hypothetical protein [Arenimonas daejeonensis]
MAGNTAHRADRRAHRQQEPDLGHRIVAAGSADTLYCDGHTVLVWIDRSGQSVLLPENVRAACAVG